LSKIIKQNNSWQLIIDYVKESCYFSNSFPSFTSLKLNHFHFQADGKERAGEAYEEYLLLLQQRNRYLLKLICTEIY